MKIATNRGSVIAKLGIGCLVCLLLGFGVLLYAQEKTKSEFIGTKPEMNAAKMKEMDASKMQAMMPPREQAGAQRNRSWGHQNRGGVDFGENTAFYKTIIDHNLFHPLGWTPPNNEPAYSLIGTAVDPNGAISQATLLETRSNRYHFVTIGTKLGDITVKDIQARQVILDKTGENITLKTGEFQPLTVKGERGGGREGGRSEGGSENQGNNNAGQNLAKAKQTQGQNSQMRRMAERIRNASEQERREMMEQFRRQRGGGNRGSRGGRGRDR